MQLLLLLLLLVLLLLKDRSPSLPYLVIAEVAAHVRGEHLAAGHGTVHCRNDALNPKRERHGRHLCMGPGKTLIEKKKKEKEEAD
jgi:hypothetical protein